MEGYTEIETKLITARVQMLQHTPFFGYLACRLKLINATKWLPTCATDGKHFYYNENFVRTLSLKELIFVFSHEVMHCVYDHMGRLGGRDPKIWNYAGDYVINVEIHDQRVGTPPKARNEKNEAVYNCLLDDKYRGQSTDQVYDLLYKEQQKDPGGFAKKIGAGNFDKHVDDMDGMEPDPTGQNGPIPLTDDEKDQIREEVKTATLQAARTAGADNVPASVQRLVLKLTDPVMNWRELLALKIQSTVKNDYSYMRVNRRNDGNSFVLPGMLPEETIDICVSIDTSGSISDSMVKDFLSELNGIMEQFNDFKIRLWCFDTRVSNKSYAEFTPENGDEIFDYKPIGGGGTEFQVNWEFMKKNDIEPLLFLMFTDGYPYGSWGDPNYCETLFIIHGNKSIVPPFGDHAYYEEHN